MGLLSGLCRGRRAGAAVATTHGPGLPALNLRRRRARSEKWYVREETGAAARRPTVLVDSSGSSRLEDGDHQQVPTTPANHEAERYQVRESYRIDDGSGEAGHPVEGARAREFQSSFCPEWSPPSHHEERKEAPPPRRPPLSKSSGAGAASWNDDGSTSRKEERSRRRRSSSRSHGSSRQHRDRSPSGSYRSSRTHRSQSASRSHRSARSRDSARRHKDRSSSRSHRSSRHRPPPPPPRADPTPEQQIAMLEAAAQSILDRVRGEACGPSRSRTSSNNNTKEGRSHSKRRHPRGHSSRRSGTHSSRSGSKGQRHSKSKESGSRSHSTARLHSGKARSKSRSKSHSQPRSRARHRPPDPDRIDYQGRCPGHPDIVLQRYSRKKGEWRTLLEECPLCGAEDSGDIEVDAEGVATKDMKVNGEESSAALSEEMDQQLSRKDEVSWKPPEKNGKPKPKRARSASQPRSTKAPPRRSRSNNPRAHAKSHPGPVEERPRRPSVDEILSHSQNQSRQSLNGSMKSEDEGAFYRELARRLVCGKSSDADKPPGAKQSANDDDSDAHLTRGTSNGTETTASLSTATSSLDPPSLPRRSSREFRHPKEVYFGGGVCESVEEDQRDCRDEFARELESGDESEEITGEDAVGTVEEGEEPADAQEGDAPYGLPCDAEANRETDGNDAPKIVRFADENNALEFLTRRVQESSIGQRLRGSFRSRNHVARRC
ncbi:hypothetical protein ACHAXT_001313 [Thalassiosira profunda]